MNNKTRQRGASTVHWLVALVPLMGFGALAIDLNNVFLSLGELRNASDAGSLEGARLLYIGNGEINYGQAPNLDGVILSANDAAEDAADDNFSQGAQVEVVSVQRGHWEFQTSSTDANGIERGGTFTPNATTEAAGLIDENGEFRSFLDVNSDTDEINAVRVRTARQSTAVQSFFGQIFGINDYSTQAESVAYVGFAGTVDASDFDVPIAMCQEVLTQGCQVGRLVPTPDQTGGWTNLVPHTDGSCGGAVDAAELNNLLAQSAMCQGPGLPGQEISLGAEIQVNNGQVQSSFSELYDCWKSNPSLDGNNDGWPDEPAVLTMPVVYGCSFGGSCSSVIGAVRIELLWMFDNDPNNAGIHNIDNTAPTQMGDWSNSDISGQVRWDSFVQHFDLQMDGTGTPATFANGGAIQKTMYFKPDCDPTSLGGTGGANYGVRARVPVLVQ